METHGPVTETRRFFFYFCVSYDLVFRPKSLIRSGSPLFLREQPQVGERVPVFCTGARKWTVASSACLMFDTRAGPVKHGAWLRGARCQATKGIHPSSAFLIWTSCSWDPHRHTRNVTGATCRRAASPTGGRSLFLAPSFSSLSPSYFPGVRCRSKAVVLLNTVNPLPLHAALSQVKQLSRATPPNPKWSCAADASNRKNG